MNNSFSNEEVDLSVLPQFQEVTFHPVENKLRTKYLSINGFLFLLIVVGILANWLYNESNLEVYILCGAVLLFVITWIIHVVLRQKHYGYSIREKDIVFKKGYFLRRTTIVPFNRVQHLSVNRSFLDKIFGIATLNIYTAGGTGSDVKVPGLLPEKAQQLNELLS